MSQLEPVFCHCTETLRLVQLVRLLDETLRHAPESNSEKLRAAVRELIERGRSIAKENFLI